MLQSSDLSAAAGHRDTPLGIADGAPIASFLSGDQPRVWRTELSHFNGATMEVQGNKLVLKRGDAAEDVGTFADKQEAVSALQAVTDALLGGNGSASSSCGAKKKCGWVKNLFKGILWIFGLLVLVVIGLTVFGQRPNGAGSAAGNLQSGVPLSADSVFGDNGAPHK